MQVDMKRKDSCNTLKCEYANRILRYKCSHPVVEGGLRCKFHDLNYGDENPKDVIDSYKSLVKLAFESNEPLVCIGFNIPQANFSNVIFQESADFSFAVFIGQASFNGAYFINEANFKSTTFKKEANFKGAIFSKRANFSGAVTGRANFGSVNFVGQGMKGM